MVSEICNPSSLAVNSGRNQRIADRESGNDAGPDNLAPDNNALHAEPFLGRASMLSVLVRAR